MGKGKASQLHLLLKWNIVFDAFGTSVFTLGIGYYIEQYTSFKAAEILFSMSLAIFLGTTLSYFTSALSDLVGAKKALTLVQILQLSIALTITLFPDSHLFPLFIFIYFMLGRVLSPIRGALPPAYFPKEELLEFKTSVRSSTLIAIAFSSIAIWLVVTQAEGRWERFSIVFIAIDLATFVACIGLTALLPEAETLKKPKNPFSFINLGFKNNIVWTLFLLGFATAGVCGAAIPFYLPSLAQHGPVILIADFLIGLAISKLSEYLIKRHKNYFSSQYILQSVLFSLALATVAAFIVSLASYLQTEQSKFYALIIAILMSEIALTLLSLSLWNAQYELGPDERRGAIVGFYSMSSSYGSALSPALLAKSLA